MKKNKLLLFLFFVFSSHISIAQFRQVAYVKSIGAGFSSNGIYKSYIIVGEGAVDSYKNNTTYTSTIGFLTHDESDLIDQHVEVGHSNLVLNISPNPTSNFVILDFGNKNASNAILKIFNSLGQMVSSKSITSTSQPIDMTFLPNGIYLFVIQNGCEIIVEKIIKRN